MRNLIGERPNLVPAGVGNSSSAMDMGIINDIFDTKPLEPSSCPADGILYDSVAEELDNKSKSEDPIPKSDVTARSTLTASKNTTEKRKANVSDTNNKATKCAPKKTKLEEFAADVQAEEVTQQQELELAKAKVQSAAQVEVATEKAKGDAQQCKKEEQLRVNFEWRRCVCDMNGIWFV